MAIIAREVLEGGEGRYTSPQLPPMMPNLREPVQGGRWKTQENFDLLTTSNEESDRAQLLQGIGSYNAFIVPSQEATPH